MTSIIRNYFFEQIKPVKKIVTRACTRTVNCFELTFLSEFLSHLYLISWFETKEPMKKYVKTSKA